MRTIVISGSVKLESHMGTWARFWEKQGFRVLCYPTKIAKKDVGRRWPHVHAAFYRHIAKTDLLFVANEDYRNQKGYIGNGTFAEIAFSMGLNLVRKKKIEIILLQPLLKTSRFFEDVDRWQKLGWLAYANPKTTAHR